MILVYTGNGKGKTSACLGQIVRAKGNGLTAAFTQFMKKDGEAGEQKLLHDWLGDNFYAGGIGFFLREEDRAAHRQAAQKTLLWVQKKLPQVDVMVLDEILYAYGSKLVTREELQQLLNIAHSQGKHLILSGRGFPMDLENQVDLITEMTEIKHPWQKGISAARGIDY